MDVYASRQCKLQQIYEFLPVRKLEREAMVGSLADVGPADGRSNLQGNQVGLLMQRYVLSRSVKQKEAVTLRVV